MRAVLMAFGGMIAIAQRRALMQWMRGKSVTDDRCKIFLM